MPLIHIIIISSVRPEATSGGQLVLHRHLCGRSDIELEVYGAEPPTLLRRFIGRLMRTRFHRRVRNFLIRQDGRWLDALLPKAPRADGRTLVLTVAHGEVFSAAWRFARRRRLPLVSIFHDWWPDVPAVHPNLRGILEERFLLLYKESAVALCVSEGMRAALGSHPRSEVLYPIPGSYDAASVPDQIEEIVSKRPFKIFYFGNLFHYGSMLKSVLEELENHPAIHLEVRGSQPNWPTEFREEMKRRGLWLEFAPVDEFANWIAAGDALLVTMSFDPSLRRQMETSFPSKLVEGVQLGKPLVIWGPEYCSAVQWARRNNFALCVTDPDPAAFLRAMEALAASPERQKSLRAGCVSARAEFNPEKIQAQFMTALESALRPESTPVS